MKAPLRRRVILTVAIPPPPNVALKIAVAWVAFTGIAAASIVFWFWTTTGVSAP